jgi:hypothetical protein
VESPTGFVVGFLAFFFITSATRLFTILHTETEAMRTVSLEKGLFMIQSFLAQHPKALG